MLISVVDFMIIERRSRKWEEFDCCLRTTTTICSSEWILFNRIIPMNKSEQILDVNTSLESFYIFISSIIDYSYDQTIALSIRMKIIRIWFPSLPRSLIHFFLIDLWKLTDKRQGQLRKSNSEVSFLFSLPPSRRFDLFQQQWTNIELIYETVVLVFLSNNELIEICHFYELECSSVLYWSK